MEKELISIVVPIYNVEEYLEKCIDSILNQTYDNLEVILVDDGGKDRCPAICDAYAVKDARIKVIHKPNGGLSDARNAGVSVAKGAYIGFVDSDDFIKPDMYEKLYSRIKETGADIAVCNFQRVNIDGEPIVEGNQSMSIYDEVFTSKQAIEHLCGMNYEYWVTAWNRLYKARIAKAVVFPKGKIHEDEYTAHMFYEKADKIVGISEPLYQYVSREDSIMTKKYSAKNLAYVEALNGRIWYCMEHGMIGIGQAFLRWMAKYLIQVSFKLNLGEQDNRKAYLESEQLFRETYQQLKKQGKIDFKTKIMAMAISMPDFVKKIIVK